MTNYRVCDSLESKITHPLDFITILGVITLQFQDSEVGMNKTTLVVVSLRGPSFGHSSAHRARCRSEGVGVQGLLDLDRNVTRRQLMFQNQGHREKFLSSYSETI